MVLKHILVRLTADVQFIQMTSKKKADGRNLYKGAIQRMTPRMSPPNRIRYDTIR